MPKSRFDPRRVHYLTVKDARGIVFLTNEYDATGKVTKQTMVDGGTYLFNYTMSGSNVIQTDVTDPRGIVSRRTFNSAGNILSYTDALGRPEEQVTTYDLQAGTNFVLSETDPLNRMTSYTYDSMGNVTSVSRLAGTADAVTTTFTYEPAFNRLSSGTDPLNHTTTYGYNTKGNLTSVTNPLIKRQRSQETLPGSRFLSLIHSTILHSTPMILGTLLVQPIPSVILRRGLLIPPAEYSV